MRRRQNGFTLIELLVVIAIIGILAAIVYSAVNSARAKARDARRLHDLRQFQTALALYYDKFNVYPCGDNNWTSGSKYMGVDSSWSPPFLDGGPDNDTCLDDTGLTDQGFITDLIAYNDPLNVKPYQYWYFVDSTRQNYVLTAALEASSMTNDNGFCTNRYEIIYSSDTSWFWANPSGAPYEGKGICAQIE